MNRSAINRFVLLSLVVVLSLLLDGCGKEQADSAADKSGSSAMTEPAKSMEPAATPPEAAQPEAAAEEQQATGDTSAATESTTPTETAQAETSQADSAGSTAEPAPTAETQSTAAPAAGDEAMLALAKKSGCLACHSVDKKVVGPAWKDVSARYKGDAEARARLIEKVSKGGKGNWTDVVGDVAMPPYYPRVTRENIEQLVDFVLSLANG